MRTLYLKLDQHTCGDQVLVIKGVGLVDVHLSVLDVTDMCMQATQSQAPSDQLHVRELLLGVSHPSCLGPLLESRYYTLRRHASKLLSSFERAAGSIWYSIESQHGAFD